MTLTRRDLLFGLSGSAVGVALTPVPWKLLDDVSIWTQRRHALPVPPRGPVSYRAAACTLCPGGCALRVRCVGTRPVSVAPAAGHPLGAGACAVGLTLHHLAYHPLRLTGPLRRPASGFEPVALDAAVARVAAGGGRRAGHAPVGPRARPSARTRRLARVARVARRAAERRLRDDLGRGRDSRRAGRGGGRAARPRPRADEDDRELRRARARRLGPARARPRRARSPARRSGGRVAVAGREPRRRVGRHRAGGRRSACARALARLVAQGAPGRLAQETLVALAPFTPERVAERTGVEAPRIAALAQSLVAGAPTIALGGGERRRRPARPRHRARDRDPEPRARQRGRARRHRAAPRAARPARIRPAHRPCRSRTFPRARSASSSSTAPTTAARCRGPPSPARSRRALSS